MDYKEKVIALLNNKELSREQKEKLEEIFHELAESEDERIRKELLNYLYDVHDDDEERARWIAYLGKQGEQKSADKIQLGKKYKCIASPRYSMFMIGEIYEAKDKFLYSFMNLCSDCFELIEDNKQNPAWSEEDEKMLKAINNSIDVECLSKNGLDYIVMVDWFKSLKNRVQPKAEWSKEDSMHLTNAILAAEKEWGIESCTSKWLKSLRPQNKWKPSDE